LPDETFIKVAKEDSFFEIGTAVLFLITSFLFFALFFRKKLFRNEQDRLVYNTYLKRIFFLLFALMFFVFFGEEISWGQRILGFETPESVMERNMQKEFNIHNFDVLHHWGNGKEHKKGIAAFFTAKRIFIYIFVLYLLILPFLVNVNELIRRLAKWFYLPVPVIELGYLFIMNLLIYRSFKFYFGYIKTVRVMSEIEEFNFALILLFIPLIWFGLPRKSTD
jgi:hypothetical protein